MHETDRKPRRPRLLEGGILRPQVIRKELTYFTAKVAQLKALLEISERLQSAEDAAYSSVEAEQ